MKKKGFFEWFFEKDTRKYKYISILLSIFLGITTFVYTWKKDKKLFLYIILITLVGGFILILIGLGGSVVILYSATRIWIIIKVLFRDEKFYENYYKNIKQ